MVRYQKPAAVFAYRRTQIRYECRLQFGLVVCWWMKALRTKRRASPMAYFPLVYLPHYVRFRTRLLLSSHCTRTPQQVSISGGATVSRRLYPTLVYTILAPYHLIQYHQFSRWYWYLGNSESRYRTAVPQAGRLPLKQPTIVTARPSLLIEKSLSHLSPSSPQIARLLRGFPSWGRRPI